MTHEFLLSGCRFQWRADHDHLECWKAFMVHNGRPEDTSFAEFYGELS